METNFIKKKSLFLYFFLSLLPFYFLTGNFGHDAIMTILGISYLIFKDKSFLNTTNKNSIIFITLFCLYLIFNSLSSEIPMKSLEGSLFYFRYFIFALFFAYILKTHESLHKILFISFFLSLFLICLDSAYQFIFGFNILGYISPHNYRLTSFFNDEMIVGSFIFKIIPILLFFFYFKFSNKSRSKINVVLICFFSLIIIFLSGERTSVFHLIIFYLLLFFGIKFDLKKKLFLIFLSIILSTIFLIFSETTKNRIIFQTYEQIQESKNLFFIGSKEHQQHYDISLRMFMDSKLIGQGPKTFRHLCSEPKFNYQNEGCSSHPHNIVIQLVSETGIIGLLFYILIYFYFIYEYFRSYFNQSIDSKLKNGSIVIYSALISYLFPFVPSNNIFGQFFNSYMWMYIGIFLYIKDYSLNRYKNSFSQKII